jgi:predicted phage terminase large subunit-like protein
MMQEQRYNDIFPEMRISSSSAAADYFEFTGGAGYYKAVGVGVGISGYRADIAAIDDPIASREDAESPTIRRKLHEWYEDDFGTRPMPGSPLFIVNTRWHEDDLVGNELQKMAEGRGEEWEIINIPAIALEDDPLGRAEGEGLWPEVFGTEFYLGKKRSLTGRSWNSLYMGNPVDEEGGVLKREDVRRYKNMPKDETRNGQIVKKVIKKVTLSVDCAEKATQRADYTAATVWIETNDKKHYLIHATRTKKEFVEMVEWIEHIAKTFGVDQILVEDRGAGTQYIQLRKVSKGAAPVIAISTKQQSKEFRFDGVTPMFAAGEVFLPETGTDWIADIEAELFAFPGGKNDDYVDTVSQYLAKAREGSASRRGVRKMRSSTNR